MIPICKFGRRETKLQNHKDSEKQNCDLNFMKEIRQRNGVHYQEINLEDQLENGCKM